MEKRINNGIKNVERTLAAHSIANDEFLIELKKQNTQYNELYEKKMAELDSIDKEQFPEAYHQMYKIVETIGLAIALNEKTIGELELNS
jgi:hypothetical protein